VIGTMPGTAPRRASDAVVVVRPGDSLWRIARRLLSAGAPESDVAVMVDVLHAHNRHTIGPDADLIRPGQRLGVPPRAPVFPAPDPTTISEAP
jgi:nucleoid-associated protein YgaU